MKKRRLAPARAPLPSFDSDKATAEFFGTHTAADVWERHVRAKSPISIRLAPEQIEAAKKIAAAKSVGY